MLRRAWPTVALLLAPCAAGAQGAPPPPTAAPTATPQPAPASPPTAPAAGGAPAPLLVASPPLVSFVPEPSGAFPSLYALPFGPQRAFRVTAGAASCTAPCSLEVAPGPAHLVVEPPSGGRYGVDVAIPATPSEVQVNCAGAAPYVWGPLAIAGGAGMVALGVVVIRQSSSSDAEAGAAAGLGLGLGAGAIGLGIYGIAVARTCRARVVPAGTTKAVRSRVAVRLVSAGLAPRVDGGVSAGLVLGF
jgi:UV excision repair protein RAD23